MNIDDAISDILTRFYEMTDAVLDKLNAPVEDVDVATNAKTLNGETPNSIIREANAVTRDHIAQKNNPHGLTAHLLGGVTKAEADALNATMSLGYFPISFISASDNPVASGSVTDLQSDSAELSSINKFTYSLKRPWRACLAGVIVVNDTVEIDFSQCPHFQTGDLYVYLICKDRTLYFDVFPTLQPETLHVMLVGSITISSSTISNVNIKAYTRLGRYRVGTSNRTGSTIVVEGAGSVLKDWAVK